MSKTGYRPLFEGAVASGTTVYVGVPIHDGAIGAQVGWLDATTAATITLELTSANAADAPVATAGSAWLWKDSGEDFTDVDPAGAAGSFLINLENVRQKRARLKIVATANCSFLIWDGLGA